MRPSLPATAERRHVRTVSNAWHLPRLALLNVQDRVARAVEIVRGRLLAGEPLAKRLFHLFGVSTIRNLGALLCPAAGWHLDHANDLLIPLDQADLAQAAAGASEIVNPQRDSR